MKRVRVGIAGFGTVGRGTATIVEDHADLIEVRLVTTAVCRRSVVKREHVPAGGRSISDWGQLVHSGDVDIGPEFQTRRCPMCASAASESRPGAGGIWRKRIGSTPESSSLVPQVPRDSGCVLHEQSLLNFLNFSTSPAVRIRCGSPEELEEIP
jgi:hypothetical protein